MKCRFRSNQVQHIQRSAASQQHTTTHQQQIARPVRCFMSLAVASAVLIGMSGHVHATPVLCGSSSTTSCEFSSGTYTNAAGNTVTATGGAAPAVYVTNGTTLTNDGTITGTSAGWDALMIGNSAGTVSGSLQTLINNGVIISTTNAAFPLTGGTAIDVIGNTIPFVIDNYGTITGGMLAIAGNNNTITLNIKGTQSVINGDVVGGLITVNLDAGATFTQANAFLVSSVSIANGATWTLGSASPSSLVPNHAGIEAIHGVTNNGTLSLVAGQTGLITGNYVQSATGVLRTNVTSDSAYGKLNVTGTATFAAGTGIDVNVSNPSFAFTAASLSNVITAGTLVQNGFTVTDNSLLFNFTPVVNGNSVSLQIVAASSGGGSGSGGSGSGGAGGGSSSGGPNSVTSSVDQQGANAARGSANVLDQFVNSFAANGTTGNGDMDNVVTALGRLSTASQVSIAAKQTLPLLAGNSVAGVQNTLTQTQSIVQNRQSSLSGISSGESVLIDKGAWIKPFGSHARQSSYEGLLGFTANTYGLVAGADAQVSSADQVGVALAYGHTNLNSGDSTAPSDADVDSYQAILYGTHRLDETTNLDYQADGGYHRTSGERRINFGGLSRQANSGFSGYSGHAGVGLSRTFALPMDRAYTTPRLSLDYSWIREAGYRENGAGALNLDVGSHTTQALIFRLGNQFDQYVGDHLKLSASLAAGYDALAKQNLISSSFVGGGATFSTYGVRPSHWLVDGGLGISGRLNSTTTVSLDYAVEGREHYTEQTVSAKLRLLF
ncbi:autotransporter domain-containing protein [Herbaspirillum sp. LeCh32-8]|uniref:autotransporter family protein n=1 Tax=Herbaspirillum sp. LeCh32-8 TaxID=2821356 RepID=UPI001AE1A6D9|nr:autotransporter outer membrane beta-barrel domain-containing protein [Herbaspirillum sp. LeCh32-8]MBP0597990.1 autotransporter domain-containing protein [Herbaspirillum sp. LeCh32-8]